MKTTIDFLNAVKSRYNLPSDYALAGKLKLSRASISRFMNGKDNLGDDTAMLVADLLEIDPVHVVACIHAERAKTEKAKKMWERFATLTAGLAVLVILSVTVPQSGHESALFAAFTGSYPVYYVKSVFEYWPLFMALFIIVFLARPRNIASKK